MLAVAIPALADTGLQLGVLLVGDPKIFAPRIASAAGTFGANDAVTLIAIPSMLRFCCAKVLREDDQPSKAVRIMDREAQSTRTLRLSWIPAAMAGGLAIAVKGNRNVEKRGERKAWVDVDGDGKAEMLAFCMSSEGVHITAWRQSGASERIWHAYHYLGQDIEPNCAPGEVR